MKADKKGQMWKVKSGIVDELLGKKTWESTPHM